MVAGFVVGGAVSVRSRRTARCLAEKPREVLKIAEDVRLNKFFLYDENKGTQRELNLKEKEYLFMDALYSYWAADAEAIMGDTEFDLLKEDLAWQGSQLMLFNEKEMKFMEAARAYYRGTPVMSDDEFDKLRQELVLDGSPVAISRGPKCSLETKICSTDCKPDKQRMFALYLPAAGIAALVWAALSFELTPLRNINHLYTLIGGIPLIAGFAKITTSAAFPPPALILEGACPNCGADIRIYFGDVLTVPGFHETGQVKCKACKAEVRVNEETRKYEISADKMTM